MALTDDIRNAVIEMDPDRVKTLIGQAIRENASPMDLVEKGLIPGIEVVGERFKNFEIFLPEVMMSARAFKDGFEMIAPKLKESGYEPKGRIVVGAVQGDIHDIGKNIVLAILQGNGYEVHDAGVDTPPEKFVKMAKELDADVIGMSSLLTTTMAKMKETVEALKAAGLRERVKVIIGGAPTSAEYATQIGADGYGEDATEAVALVRTLLGR